MPAIVVPDLKRKFALLRTYSTRRTWPDLAEAFGRSYKTLQSWQDGTQVQDEERIPGWAVRILSRLIGEALPRTMSDDEIRQFVFGPAALLEEEIRSGAAVSLLELLNREARQGSATLIRKDTSIGLVEVETEDRSPCPHLQFGEEFRIAIRRRLPSGYPLALQHAQHVWAPLPAMPSGTEPGVIWVPGAKRNGDPLFMQERRDPGRHLFVCMETPAPAPATLRAAGRDEIGLDKRALDALAAFYRDQPARRRACHRLTVEIGSAA